MLRETSKKLIQGRSHDEAPDAHLRLGAVFALATATAQAEMKNEWVEYSHGDTKLKAYMAYDDRGLENALPC